MAEKKSVRALNRVFARVGGYLRLLGNSRFLVRRLQRGFIFRHTRNTIFPVVVDIGVGAAPYRAMVRHERYIGVDSENRGGVPDLVVADVNQGIPLPDASADLVLCTEVLEHTKAPHSVARELFRILKPGGIALVTVPMTWPLHEIPNDHFRFTEYGMAYFFQDAGFSDVQVAGTNGYYYTLCMLSLLRKRRRWWYPVVVCVNIIGILLFRFEKDRTFPLGIHLCATR